MRFLTNRFVFLLAGIGFVVSFLFGLVARVNVGIVLFRAVVSGVGMGGLGFLFLFVLSRVLPTADFEELMLLIEGKSPSEMASSESTATMPLGEQETSPLSSGTTINVVEDSDTWETGVSSGSPEETSLEWQEKTFDPAAAVGAPEDEDKEFSSHEPPSSLREEYEQLRTEYEKEKPTFKDNTVSFKVNDKKINTSPEIVAKAIKTILSRES
ncbi:MAG: hypothetical protein N2314_00445 [Brevinematales bacterium]|nr:hypothetical protein [Brevinematales bacterium]